MIIRQYIDGAKSGDCKANIIPIIDNCFQHLAKYVLAFHYVIKLTL